MRFSILSAMVLAIPALATFSSPKGGDKWNVGQEQTISWDTNGLEGLIDIKLVPGGATDTTIIITEIATQVENKGSIKWTPDKSIKTTDVTIIIIDSKQTRSSSELFVLVVDIQTVQSNSNNNNNNNYNNNNNNYNNNDNNKGDGKGSNNYGNGSGKDSNGNNYGGNNNYDNGNGKGSENNNYNNGSKDDGKNNTKPYESKSENSRTKSNEYNNGGKSTKSEEQKMTKSEDKMTKTKSEGSKMTTTAMKESKADTTTISHAMTTSVAKETKTKETVAITTPEIATFTPSASLVVLTPLVSEITKASETKAEKTTKTTSQGSTITNQIFITETAGQGLTTFRASTTAAQAVNGTRAIQASGTGTGGSGQQFFGAASSVSVPGTIVGGFFGLLSILFL
ncbi:hypothetical protein BGZ60DRAFT_526459 [Tricladium varicosporioides]|nr:hypothetical protein BGZ60DRAFT_526459 [Hymenoscyphus varicosporioides]